MPNLTYTLDRHETDALEAKILQLPKKAEKAINEVLHMDGIELVTREISKLIPNSSWKSGITKNNHARNSMWFKYEVDNLAFVVKSKGGAAKNKGSYGYLVFPDEGRGSSNPVKQDFVKHGLERATPQILERIHKKLDEMIEEVF